MESEKPTAIDLFCGAGGLSEGLVDAGFEIKWAIDNEEKVKPTFEANHKTNMVVGDIRKIDPPDLDLPEHGLELVAGGPPCPTFSLVGRSKINSLEGQNNIDDERHHLYQDFLRYVSHFEPKAFIMENVEGMMSAENKDGDPVVEIIKSQMEELGYKVNVQVLDAANFGVPQHRNRIFFIGNRLGRENPDMKKWRTHRPPKNEKEKKIKFKRNYKEKTNENQMTLNESAGIRTEEQLPVFKKNKTPKKPWTTVADAIFDLPPVSPDGEIPPTKAEKYEIGPVSEYQYWVRNIPEDTDWSDMPLWNHECRGHNMRDLTLYKLLGEGVSWIIGDIPEEHQPYRTDIFPDKLKKQNPRKPSSTIVAHLYKDGHMFIHPREARSITVREAARLQSFKDTFKFPVARTHAFKQVGNAVPPLLAQAIGTAIKKEVLKK
ncbi:Site-specific DNA methylase [Methanonatronarchaeum thermophilum]|uniref:DNA (cytosine-5-)-methyltransferase n=1 Tax=Methanonatronarchaeum thermophilum TaxID=1927129 RepID=A0A1Y3GF07_9EURY|nr:DNA cytosine methyltransferase [Methanonatronarchaeum thermophilum]OUJ18774.1 Site-specific DNA methylase [Methanonatronarchaeum thermophilum]